jgi:hypothetical protein
MVQYELARRRIEVGERLLRHAPRPLLVQGEGGESSGLSTLLLARMLPGLAQNGPDLQGARDALGDTARALVDNEE